MSKLIYAGFGARDTPEDVLKEMRYLAHNLAQMGYTLNTGGAFGADEAFRLGAIQGKGKVELYLPWRRFNNHSGGIYNYRDFEYDVAAEHHPNWIACSTGTRKLMTRNAAMILSQCNHSPLAFAVCWTKNGKTIGGSGHTIRVAKAEKVIVYNYGDYTIIGTLTRHILGYAQRWKELVLPPS